MPSSDATAAFMPAPPITRVHLAALTERVHRRVIRFLPARGPARRRRGPPTDWAELVHVQDDRDVFQASPEDLPVIDIRSL